MVRGRGISRSQGGSREHPSYSRGATSSDGIPSPSTDSNQVEATPNQVAATPLDDNSNIDGGSDAIGSSLNRVHTDVINGILNPSGPCSSRIRKIFEERLYVAGSSWKKVSSETKKFYFEEFKKYFMWTEGSTDAMVHDAWTKSARTRYRDMLNDIKGKAKPVFIADAVWERWQADWKDPNYIRVAQQNSVNRLSEVGGSGAGPSRHTGSSLSHAHHRKRLANKLGREPTLQELFRHTHTKNHDGQTFVDERSKNINTTIESLREELSQPQDGSTEPHEVDEEELYLRAVGGERKRRIYGIGSQASAVLGSSSSNSHASSSSNVELQNRVLELQEEVNQLNARESERVQEMERKVHEMESKMQTMNERMQEQMDERMQEKIEAAMQGLISRFRTHPSPPPHD